MSTLTDTKTAVPIPRATDHLTLSMFCAVSAGAIIGLPTYAYLYD